MLFFSEMAYSLLADFVSSKNINGNVSLAFCHSYHIWLHRKMILSLQVVVCVMLL